MQHATTCPNLCVYCVFVSPQEFAALIDEARPVVIKNAAQELFGADYNHFSRENFVKRYGDATVSVGALPYANEFKKGRGGTEEKSLHEYVSSFFNPGDIPLYLYSSKFVEENSEVGVSPNTVAVLSLSLLVAR